LQSAMMRAFTMIIGAINLTLILNGVITNQEQLLGEVNKQDLQYLAGAMEIENGNETNAPYDDMMRLLLTGSVILNRVKSSKWNGDTIEEVILAKDGGFIQYASVTRDGFKTKKAKERTILLAKYLLIYGPICPESVVYQGQNPSCGSGIYKSIPVKGDKDEFFCFQ